MFRTQFLVNEDEGWKDFSSNNTFQLSSKRIDLQLRKQTLAEIHQRTTSVQMFSFSSGAVELKYPNTLYCLEHLPANTDLLLPKSPNLQDWVVLFYEQTTLATKVSREKLTKIKIRGNGKRIMGLDEHLVCDMPFMSLRLTFLGDMDGWVVS